MDDATRLEKEDELSTESKTIVYTSQPKWVTQEPINFDRKMVDGAKRIVRIWFGQEKDQTLVVDWEETKKQGRIIATGIIRGENCKLNIDGLLTGGSMNWGGESSAVQIQ